MSSWTEKDLHELNKELTFHCSEAIEIEASIDGEEVDCQLFIRKGSIVGEEIIPKPLEERRSEQNVLADLMEEHILSWKNEPPPVYRGDNWY